MTEELCRGIKLEVGQIWEDNEGGVSVICPSSADSLKSYPFWFEGQYHVTGTGQQYASGGGRFLIKYHGGVSATQLLEKAKQLQLERAKTYDSPSGERSMAKTVAAFNAITGKTLTEEEGWEFMLLLKQVRLFTNPGSPHRDSIEDGVSYAALLGECMLKGKL